MRAVQPLGQRRFRRRRDRKSPRPAAAARVAAPLAHAVQRGVAADQDQPGGGIARRPVLRPAFQRAQTGVLKRLLGRCPGRGNSAAGRPPPAAAPRSAPPSIQADVGHDLTLPPARRPVGIIERDGADLIGAAGIGRGQLAGDVQRLVEIVDVDHVEAQQLLLGLGERAVDDQRRLLGLAQGGRGGGRQQAQDGPSLPAFDQPLLDRARAWP